MSNSRTPLGKRFLSVLLVLVMVIGMLPTIAFAADTREVTYYKKVTELTTEREYLIVAESGSTAYALNLSGSTLSATEVTVDANNRIDSKVDGSAPATVWTATQSGTDWQFNSDSNYLRLTQSVSQESEYTEYTYSCNPVESNSSFKAWTLSNGTLSMHVVTKDYPGDNHNDEYANYYLSYNSSDGLSATTDETAATAFSFYQKVTETQTLVGIDVDGKKVWSNDPNPVVTATVVTPAADSEDETALNAANAAANDASPQKWDKTALKVLGVYNVVATYDTTTIMKTLEKPVNVTLDVAGVKKNDAVMVAHWNGSSFDTPIQAKATVDDKVTFKADTFSPFVVISGIGYNNITIINTTPGCTITGNGTVVTGTDYTFTVTVNSGYDASNLVVNANGNVFETGDPMYEFTGNTGKVYSYTIHAVDDNYTISAIISETTYSVTYKKNADSDVVTGMPDSVTGIAYGSSYIISNAEPTRAGYTFQGWDSDNDGDVDYQPGATITVSDNVTLYAVWAQNTVKVTLPASGTGYTITSDTLNVGGNTTVNEGTLQTFTVTAATGYDPATMKVTANGKELSATTVSGSTYTYKFVADVDTTIAVVAPSVLKYTITLPTGEHFTAKFTNPTGAVGKGSYTFDYGTTDAKFTVQLKDGYTGTVYIDGAAQHEIAKNGTATYTLHATGGGITHVCDIRVETAKVQTYTVTYTIDGQAYTTRTVDKDTLVKSLANIAVPSKEGYTFGGWYSDTTLNTALGSASGTVDGDMEVYGKWTPVQGTIKYDLKSGSGSFANQTKVYGEALQLHPAIPTRTGYTFKGWATVEDGVAVYQPGDMYATEIGTGEVTLYAVWEQITYTVTLPTGTGYSISTSQSTTVEHGKDFTFTVKVDRGYARTIPTVKANGTDDYTPTDLTAAATDGTRSYTITIRSITADQVVTVDVAKNATYTVTFYTWKNGGTTTEVYQTQQVEDTYKATQPAAPVIEGYTFGGWYNVVDATGSEVQFTLGAAGKKLGTTYNFDDAVTGNVNVVAKMVAITPVVTIPANVTSNGWTIDFDTTKDTTGTGTGRIHTHPYNTDCIFTVTIAEGYDASNMQVGANGVALAPISIVGNVYTYKLTGVKVNTTITVVGVVRKTVTITYNANAGDDVSEMPGQQVINQYIETAPASDSNETITTQIPTRVGYEFKGWSTKSDLGPADYDVSEFATGYHYYAKGAATPDADTILHAGGVISRETKDTTLYAIWEANATTIGLTVSDTVDDTAANKQEYEGQKVTLTATIVAAPSTGSVIFYQSSDNGTTWTVISSQSANGSDKYTFEATTGAYSGTDTYKVAYKAESAEGYGSSNSNKVSVDRLSTTITWKLDSDAVLNTAPASEGPAYYYASTLTITPDGGSALTPGTAMTAGQTYTLTAPAVYELGTTTALTVGTDYTITWQYLDGANGWTTRAENQTTSTYKVTSEYSEYQFRALMVVNTGVSTVYTKAAKFDGEYKGDLNTTETMSWLISEPTPAVALQQTKTTLAITGADNEGGDVVINGVNTVFSGIGAHKAQFEGQTVTLTATVKETSTGTPAVASGSVEFYQNGTLIATVPVETAGDNMGKASCTATMKAFSGTATTAKDTFYAKYVENATYDDSTSATSDVYIKSTKIQTPVIDEINDNSAVIGSTTYDDDLDGLLAGVEHKFTLRETGASTSVASDWSVVALDGRTVASTDYTIKWLATTGDNEEATVANGSSYTTSDNKVGDMFRVELVPTGDMKTGATSKYAKIGTKQDVTVTVTAEDVITSTAVDRANGKYPDVYQLNKITLTATVAAAANNATMQPSENSTVAFYYKDSNNDWIKLGEAVLTKDTDGQMRASIDTTKLPVTDGTNVKRDVEITAVYLGDETFKVSGNYTESTRTVTAGTGATGNGVTDETVTVYSSVVYVNSGVENKAINPVSQSHASGIYIKVTDGTLATFESAVELTLSDIYTLDYQTDPEIAKLAFGDAAKDYSIEWQYTDAKSDYENAVWYKVEGSTNSKICNFTVANDGRAYRAVVTVEDKPITQGSHTAVKQTVAGRQVYYSNILVAQDNQVTVTTNVNTSNTADGYEGIVEGETVTIHTYVAGAASVEGVANNSVTVTIKDSSDKVVYKQTKNDVLGHTSFTWNTLKTWDEDSKTFTDVAMKPGYYTMTVATDSNNGYNAAEITRQLIIRDAAYSFTVSGDGVAYNGKAQGLKVTVGGMDIESDLAQKSVVVYYYTDEARTQQVLPIQAGNYYATIRLQESAYWTEKTLNTTFTIAKRQLSIEDVIVQAKVYDGTTTANVQEIILKDAATGSNGLPNVDTGVINGDSVFVTGTAVTNSADVKDATTVTVTAGELQGDDAANYELPVKTFTEAFKIQRSQVQGDIGASTYKYTGRDIKVDLTRDIYLIDQQGERMTLTDADVIYYYHSGNGVKQVSAMNWKGMYTVIARPDQNNYKGGASVNVYVGDSESLVDPQTNFKSALISITNTVELFDGTPAGVTVTVTSGSVDEIAYNGSTTVPAVPGRYLVKVTTDTNDTAYGIYTLVKAHPTMDLKATDAEYTSAQYNGAPEYTGNVPVDYYTYTGGTIQGVSYTEPTEAGKYVITAHVNETAQYTSHEVSAVFTITEKPLTITADSWSRVTNGTFPDMTATFTGLATGGIAPDTSLRDVQIQPEMIFDGYDNVDKTTNGNFPVTPVAALARNYKITYMPGQFTTTPTTAKPEFAIHGMIDAGNVPSGYDGIAYFGDKIQLYAYGTRSNGKDNTSAVLTWSVDNAAVASITQDGLLTINGVGDVTVSLKRGRGDSAITTQIKIKTYKQEVKVVLESDDVVYSGTQQTYNESGKQAINAKLKHVSNSLNAKIEIDEATNKRTDIGSQIVEATVSSSTKFYQSETYGGLFTINDAEIVVAPKAVSTTYGTAATMSNVYDTGYTETTRVAGGTAALTGAVVASIADAYNNLDASTYEILVAGTEDMNYNVKYTTNPHAEVVTVTALENTLKYTTGVIAGSTGRTSGSAIDASGFNPDEGAVVTYADPTVEPNDRMYGEPNPAMNYLFNGLIAGDSAADLVKLIELVGFVPGIDKEANVAFTDAHISASGVATGKSGTYLSGKSYYETTTALPVNGVKNYLMENTDITLGIQNVYQRPFTLKLTGNKTDLRVYKPLVINGSTVNKAKLLEIILDNMEVVEYESGGKKYGGLATKLGHTINDVNLEIVSATYDSVAGTINVELKCNDNYWLSNKNWTIVVDPSMITVSYGTLGKYSSSVTMYGIDEDGNNIGATNVTGKVWYEIYVEDTSLQRKYSNYKDLTPVVRVQMTKGNGKGVYVANYNSTPLSAGHYVMFAIAEDYTIIE